MQARRLLVLAAPLLMIVPASGAPAAGITGEEACDLETCLSFELSGTLFGYPSVPVLGEVQGAFSGTWTMRGGPLQLWDGVLHAVLPGETYDYIHCSFQGAYNADVSSAEFTFESVSPCCTAEGAYPCGLFLSLWEADEIVATVDAGHMELSGVLHGIGAGATVECAGVFLPEVANFNLRCIAHAGARFVRIGTICRAPRVGRYHFVGKELRVDEAVSDDETVLGNIVIINKEPREGGSGFKFDCKTTGKGKQGKITYKVTNQANIQRESTYVLSVR